MKFCEKCNLYHEDKHKTCVACGRVLVDKDYQSKLLTPGYPEVLVLRKKPSIAARVLVLVGILISLVCAIINMFTFKDSNSYWSLIVIGALIYTLLVIKQVIIAKHDYSTKTLKQVLIVSIILLAIDFATNYKGWAITYGIPFVIVGTSVILPIVVASMPKKYYMHVRNLFWLIILNLIITIISFLTPLMIEGIIWTGAMSLVTGITLFSAMLLFAPKITYHELVKFFHM